MKLLKLTILLIVLLSGNFINKAKAALITSQCGTYAGLPAHAVTWPVSTNLVFLGINVYTEVQEFGTTRHDAHGASYEYDDFQPALTVLWGGIPGNTYRIEGRSDIALYRPSLGGFVESDEDNCDESVVHGAPPPEPNFGLSG